MFINKFKTIVGFAVLMTSASLQAGGGLLYYLDGSNVSSVMHLPNANPSNVFWHCGLWGKFILWNHAWQMSEFGNISFRAFATSDITIGITNVNPWSYTLSGDFYGTLTDSDHLYDIIIGESNNSRSVIRKGALSEPVITVEQGFPANIPVLFNISFYQFNNSNIIQVAYLNPGDQKWVKLMTYEDPSYIRGNNHWVSFTTYASAICYSDIKVSRFPFPIH